MATKSDPGQVFLSKDVTAARALPAAMPQPQRKLCSMPTIPESRLGAAVKERNTSSLAMRVDGRKAICRKMRSSLHGLLGVEGVSAAQKFKALARSTFKGVHEVMLEEHVAALWKEQAGLGTSETRGEERRCVASEESLPDVASLKMGETFQSQSGALKEDRDCSASKDHLIHEMGGLAGALENLLTAQSDDTTRIAMVTARERIAQLTSLHDAFHLDLQDLEGLGNAFREQMTHLAKILSMLSSDLTVHHKAGDAENYGLSQCCTSRNLWTPIIEHSLSQLGLLQNSLSNSTPSSSRVGDRDDAAVFWKKFVGDKVSIGQELRKTHNVGNSATSCRRDRRCDYGHENGREIGHVIHSSSDESGHGNAASKSLSNGDESTYENDGSNTPAVSRGSVHTSDVIDIPHGEAVRQVVEVPRIASAICCAVENSNKPRGLKHNAGDLRQNQKCYALESSKSTNAVSPLRTGETLEINHEQNSPAAMPARSVETLSARKSSVHANSDDEDQSAHCSTNCRIVSRPPEHGYHVITLSFGEHCCPQGYSASESRVDTVSLVDGRCTDIAAERAVDPDACCESGGRGPGSASDGPYCYYCCDKFTSYGLGETERILLAEVVAERSNTYSKSCALGVLSPVKATTSRQMLQEFHRKCFQRTLLSQRVMKTQEHNLMPRPATSRTMDKIHNLKAASVCQGSTGQQQWRKPVDLPTLLGRTRSRLSK